MHIFHNTNFNFLKWRWHAIAVSWIIILAGIITIWTKGIPKGIEFAGGTVVIVQFDQGEPDDQLSKLYAFDGATGAVVWEKPRPVGASWATPIS